MTNEQLAKALSIGKKPYKCIKDNVTRYTLSSSLKQTHAKLTGHVCVEITLEEFLANREDIQYADRIH